MSRVWISLVVLCGVVMLATPQVRGNIYTVGRWGSPSEGSETLEWWNSGDVTAASSNAFETPRLGVGDIGETKPGTWHWPHDAIGVGDINDGNAGKELIFVGSDGIGIVTRLDASGDRIGGGLVFPNHVATTGALMATIADVDSSNAGNEIITVAGNNIQEIWKYKQSDGTIDSRLKVIDWRSFYGEGETSMVLQMALGEFDSGNTGLEIAVLRNDGWVDIWDAYDGNSADRLARWTVAEGGTYDHFFAGDLDSGHAGDELVTIASDGTLEIWNPLGLSGNADLLGLGENNVYDASSHDPFRAVCADVIPEPATMGLLLTGGLMLCLRRRRQR